MNSAYTDNFKIKQKPFADYNQNRQMQRQLNYPSSSNNSQSLALPSNNTQDRYASPAGAKRQAQASEGTPGAAVLSTPTKVSRHGADAGDKYRTPERRYESEMESDFDKQRNESFFKRPSKKDS